MKNKKLLFTWVIALMCLKLAAQSADTITDSAATYANNIAYNTGEVYVIFNILGNTYISKDSNEVATEDRIFGGISIYPNPVDDVLYIVAKEGKVSQVSLYGMDGRMVLQKSLTSNQVDISSLLKGVYILKTNCSDANFKIIKR